MPLVRRQLRRVAWVALFALLGLLFGPLLAHAAVPAFGEICSTAHAPGDVPGDQPLGTLQHCPLCVHHGAFTALPGPRIATLQPLAASAERPICVAPAPSPHFAWLAAAPRGPPSAA